MKHSGGVVPKPGPPPVITKIRLKSAEKALITVITNENWTKRVSSGRGTLKKIFGLDSPAALAASASGGASAARPARNMLGFVPTAHEVQGVASAANGPCSLARTCEAEQ